MTAGGALRGPIIATVEMRILWTVAVSSPTASTMWIGIPAGISPDINYGNNALYVYPDGDFYTIIYGMDWDSCGNISTIKNSKFRSPYVYVYYHNYAYHVDDDGHVVYSHVYWNNSCEIFIY